MALLFVYDRSKDSFSETLGVDKKTWIEMHKKLFDMVVEDIEINLETEVDGEITFIQSRLEYAQALAEYLGRDLTPELGLLIGLVISEAEKMTKKIMTHNGYMGGKEES
mgnify:CR=1 FL=1